MTEDESAALSGEQRRALLVLGYLFLRMGQFARAKKLFAALLALDPGDAWARRSLAAAFLALGDGAHRQGYGHSPPALTRRRAASAQSARTVADRTRR